MASAPVVLDVRFFSTGAGTQPVREWLKEELSPGARKAVGETLKTVQFRWPLGMPWVRKMGPDLWEVRARIPEGIARVLFTILPLRPEERPADGPTTGLLIALHGFVKKSSNASRGSGYGAQASRPFERIAILNRMHVGDRLDDLLAEEGVLAEVEAAALRRVAALELRDLMKKVRVSKATLARRMGTSRAQLDRMLDPTGESSLTLRSLSAAVTAMGHTVSVKFERRARSSPATRTGKSKEKGAGHVASTAKTAKRSRV